MWELVLIKRGVNVFFLPNILDVLYAEFNLDCEFSIKHDQIYDLTNLWVFKVAKAVVMGGRVMVVKS